MRFLCALIAVLMLAAFPVMAQSPAPELGNNLDRPLQAPKAPAITAPIDSTRAPTQAASPVDAATARAYEEQCLAKIPRRFTPQGHEVFCACSAAALRATMSASEYASLRDSVAQRPENKVFEKYVDNVVRPCMDEPVKDIAYLECVLDRANDPRIGNIPTFCTCVGKRMAWYVLNSGTVDAMLLMSSPTSNIRDPIQAMLRSHGFVSYRRSAVQACFDERFRK